MPSIATKNYPESPESALAKLPVSAPERRLTIAIGGHRFAGASDATRAPDGKMPLPFLIWSLHAFIASLYELFLLADIRFFIQPTICATIWRLLIVG
jgi:hypothetical protein